MKQSHKTVDEVLFYSGAMPKALNDKPEGRLIARVTIGGKMIRPFESGHVDYCIFMTNKIPISLGSIGYTKDSDVTLQCVDLPKKEASTISLK